MRLFRLPLIFLSVSPLIALFRAYRAADAKVKGLLSNDEAQRQLLNNAVYAGVVYFALLAFCVWHLSRQTGMGSTRKALWIVGMALLPVIFVPSYLIVHAYS